MTLRKLLPVSPPISLLLRVLWKVEQVEINSKAALWGWTWSILGTVCCGVHFPCASGLLIFLGVSERAADSLSRWRHKNKIAWHRETRC